MADKGNLLTVLLSGIRRRWFIYFRPRYTMHSLANRKGQCLSCGRCCLLNKPWCRHLKENKCQAYVRQPFFCKAFPIDEKDKDMSDVFKECGYYWRGNGKD